MVDIDVAGSKDVRLAIVIATLNRPAEMERLLQSLNAQTRLPDEIIIADGGQAPDSRILNQLVRLPIKYLHSAPPSTSRQRNDGISLISPDISLVGFLDDDCTLEPEALSRMLDYWASAPADLAGAAFNMINHPPQNVYFEKILPLLDRLGIYSAVPGQVAASGFQSMIGFVSRSIYVKWLPSGAAVWRRQIVEKYQFDVWYDGYGYLEDLDLSYELGEKYRLAVVADAGYTHLPRWGSRSGKFAFGRKEILNRLHFVRKHPELSVPMCYVTLILRTLMTLSLGVVHPGKGFLQRAFGNVCGLLGL